MLENMTRLRVPFLTGCAAVVVGLAGCGSSSSSSTAAPSSAAPSSATTSSAAAPAAAGDTITIKNFDFGQALTVKAGQKISVINQDSAPHTVTADDGKSFDAPAAANGGTGSFTAPTKPGTYPFHCTIHPMMHGTLTVA